MIARTSGNGTADKLFVIPEGNLFVSGKNVCCKCIQCTTGIRYLPLIAGTSDDGTSDVLFVPAEWWGLSRRMAGTKENLM